MFSLNTQILDLNTRLFPLLIIAVQLSTLIIQWISIFIVTIQALHMDARYQRCLFIFIVVLLLLQAACFAAQALITLHCVFNLKFISTFLDYSKSFDNWLFIEIMHVFFLLRLLVSNCRCDMYNYFDSLVRLYFYTVW